MKPPNCLFECCLNTSSKQVESIKRDERNKRETREKRRDMESLELERHRDPKKERQERANERWKKNARDRDQKMAT